MTFIGIIVFLILVSWAWNQEQRSQRESNWMMKNDPDFRDLPGNKYYHR